MNTYGEPLSYLESRRENQRNQNELSFSKVNQTATSYNKQSTSSTPEYEVSFKIFYKTELGENIFVVGDLPELGKANDIQKHPLKWTAGHIWVSVKPIRTKMAMFRYSYAQIDERTKLKVDHDENIKRIADLKSMSSHNF
jgi:hypothetical protein